MRARSSSLWPSMSELASSVSSDKVKGSCCMIPPIGPGAVPRASDRPGAERHNEAVHAASTFKVEAPVLATTVKPGEKKQVELLISRGREFHQNVKLQVESPTGLKVEPATVEVPEN